MSVWLAIEMVVGLFDAMHFLSERRTDVRVIRRLSDKSLITTVRSAAMHLEKLHAKAQAAGKDARLADEMAGRRRFLTTLCLEMFDRGETRGGAFGGVAIHAATSVKCGIEKNQAIIAAVKSTIFERSGVRFSAEWSDQASLQS